MAKPNVRRDGQVLGTDKAMQKREAAQAKPPSDDLTIHLSRKELATLLRGAIKGNVVYGSVDSKAGQTTLRVTERLCAEFDLDLETDTS